MLEKSSSLRVCLPSIIHGRQTRSKLDFSSKFVPVLHAPLLRKDYSLPMATGKTTSEDNEMLVPLTKVVEKRLVLPMVREVFDTPMASSSAAESFSYDIRRLELPLQDEAKVLPRHLHHQSAALQNRSPKLPRTTRWRISSS